MNERGRLVVVAAVAALASACVTSGQIEEREGVLRSQIKMVREKQRGEECAARNLAIAEANVDFAAIEADEGYGGRAIDHLDIAEAAARKAVEESKPCAAVKVVIPNAPKVQVAVTARDTDGDGIPDPDDDCPLVPGVRQPHPKNGCPLPTDRDGDGVPDDIDRCPDVAGPKENDGCPWPDRDKDGVPDREDRCPDVPGPASNQGCPLDRDGDGIPDDKDLCPDEPGVPELQGCPIKDSDGDGVPDHLDKCPLIAGPPENNGCPWPDRDGDGVPDKDDKCPDVPGLKKFAGCPDTDGDGIPDPDDDCPTEPGPSAPHPRNGCPPPPPEIRHYSLVVVTKKQIEIKQQVHFATNKWEILPDSFELLNQVAQVMKDYASMNIEVQGHTDNVSGRAHNLKLSQHRADSVRTYLVKQGIDPSRLTAKGFAFDVPIASNSTERGRAANRRVEFHITAQ